MSDNLIPLTTAPNQTFTAVLNVNNAILRLNLTIRYNEMATYWVMTIADQNNNVLLDSIPLLTGTWPAANILQQYQYLNIGSAYVINAGSQTLYDYPNITDLGTDFVLVWSDNV